MRRRARNPIHAVKAFLSQAQIHPLGGKSLSALSVELEELQVRLRRAKAFESRVSLSEDIERLLGGQGFYLP
jgi:hypothetical protein